MDIGHCLLCGGDLTRQSFFHHTFFKCPSCAVYILDDESFYGFVLTALEHPVQLESLLQNIDEMTSTFPLDCAHCNSVLTRREVFVEHTELVLYECLTCRQIIMQPADLLLLQNGAEHNKQREIRNRLAGKAV